MLHTRTQLRAERAPETIPDLRARIVAGELHPIAALLQENQALLEELQVEPFTETDSGMLESYLAKICRDRAAKHANMKQRLAQLAVNSTAIVTLIKVCAPHSRTMAFTTDADKFRNHASAWRDRWNSVMELFYVGRKLRRVGSSIPKAIPRGCTGGDCSGEVPADGSAHRATG